jgi:hypothetical protein
MVHQSDLVAAVAAARASSDAADAKAKEIEWQQQQLNQTREQLQLARQEVLRLQKSMDDMVSSAELKQFKDTAIAEQQEAVTGLRQRICSLESEKIELEQHLQVRPVLAYFLVFSAMSAPLFAGFTS